MGTNSNCKAMPVRILKFTLLLNWFVKVAAFLLASVIHCLCAHEATTFY